MVTIDRNAQQERKKLQMAMNVEDYMTVREFAKRAGISSQRVYLLLKEGNEYRKLDGRKFAGKWMIKSSELTEYPFDKAYMLLKKLYDQINDISARIQKLERIVNGLP